jgi:hypothetical protein
MASLLFNIDLLLVEEFGEARSSREVVAQVLLVDVLPGSDADK